jgi:hypothetical protein
MNRANHLAALALLFYAGAVSAQEVARFPLYGTSATVSLRELVRGPESTSGPGLSVLLHIPDETKRNNVLTEKDVWKLRVNAWVLMEEGGSLPFRGAGGVVGVSFGGSYVVYSLLFDWPSRSLTGIQAIALRIDDQMFVFRIPDGFQIRY